MGAWEGAKGTAKAVGGRHSQVQTTSAASTIQMRVQCPGPLGGGISESDKRQDMVFPTPPR